MVGLTQKGVQAPFVIFMQFKELKVTIMKVLIKEHMYSKAWQLVFL